MAHEKKNWHPAFIKYIDFILNHQNYKGLPIKNINKGSSSWLASAKTEIGKDRIIWCEEKARQLGMIVEPGVYAKVMLDIHPTKWKVCQICGKKMSLYYHYPNANFVKSIKSTFNIECSKVEHISDIWETLLQHNFDHDIIAAFMIKQGALILNPCSTSKTEIIANLENVCRNNGKALLGPGAMSNFPDRFDGFHSYNRCCRSIQDKGRSKENLKSYTKDRRAYEHWSGGNIQAANQFMGSPFFKDKSADHVGPISLGFIHDPRYLQLMERRENSSKRDRLLFTDIEKIIEIEKRTKICPMSWYSNLIWEHIRNNYKNNKKLISSLYRNALKQNMSNYMCVLSYIYNNCPSKGEIFLNETLLEPTYDYFKYLYEFNDLGEITSRSDRHFTKQTQGETKRYNRVALQSLKHYENKDNRNIKPNLTVDEKVMLVNLCDRISRGVSSLCCKKELVVLIETIEKRIIALLKKKEDVKL
ncbi:MAG: Alw26I/Eco31I/Esp3I family type II restriction endonuclease [Synergistaceae bacterium]|nr:Alw26I/Eco31I/Esp3I family type II restriction endonuclease [Synergistaceae bacterium]